MLYLHLRSSRQIWKINAKLWKNIFIHSRDTNICIDMLLYLNIYILDLNIQRIRLFLRIVVFLHDTMLNNRKNCTLQKVPLLLQQTSLEASRVDARALTKFPTYLKGIISRRILYTFAPYSYKTSVNRINFLIRARCFPRDALPPTRRSLTSCK